MTKFLPPEIFQTIFDYLSEDVQTLYACLLVNKNWSSNAVKPLWQRPLSITHSPVLTQQYIRILVYQKSNEEQIQNEKNENFASRLSFPCYNYILFLEEFSLSSTYAAMDKWFSFHNDLPPLEPLKCFGGEEDTRYQKIFSVTLKLCRFILKTCQRMRRISLSANIRCLELEKIPIIPWSSNIPVCLSALRECEIAGHFANKEVLCGIIEKSSHIESLSVSRLLAGGLRNRQSAFQIYRPDLSDRLSEEDNIEVLINHLIRGQRGPRRVFLGGILENFVPLLDAVKIHAATITAVILDGCEFRNCRSIKDLVLCTNLQELRFINCRHLTQELLAPLAAANLDQLEIFEWWYNIVFRESDPSQQVKEILAKAGTRLREAKIGTDGTYEHSIFRAVRDYNPYIETLYAAIDRNAIPQFAIGLQNAWSKLTSLVLVRNEDQTPHFLETIVCDLGRALPPSLRFLDLGHHSLSAKYLELLLSNCPANIEHLRFSYCMQTVRPFEAIIKNYATNKSQDVKSLQCFPVFPDLSLVQGYVIDVQLSPSKHV